MTTEAHAHPNYTKVWLWLMGLALLAVIASQVRIPHMLAEFIIYSTALAKAVIVALFFMHLKKENLIIVGLVLIPLVLFFILVVTLLPDFVFSTNHT